MKLLIVLGIIFGLLMYSAAPLRDPPHLIEKEAVYSALRNQSQIVGFQGELQKDYEFNSSTLNTGMLWLDSQGNAQYHFKFLARFKIGYNIEEITVIIGAHDVTLSEPKLTLISIDITNVIVESKLGMLGKPISEEQRQQIFQNAHDRLEQEIMSDLEIQRKAKYGSKKAVEMLLMKLKNVEGVEWN